MSQFTEKVDAVGQDSNRQGHEGLMLAPPAATGQPEETLEVVSPARTHCLLSQASEAHQSPDPLFDRARHYEMSLDSVKSNGKLIISVSVSFYCLRL